MYELLLQKNYNLDLKMGSVCAVFKNTAHKSSPFWASLWFSSVVTLHIFVKFYI